MTRKSKQNKIPPRPEKPKGPVTLGRTTFIDKIIRKYESQSSIGPRIIIARRPIDFLQTTGSPSVSNAKIHGETEGVEQSFQDTENPQTSPSQEGNSSTLCKGGGETGEI